MKQQIALELIQKHENIIELVLEIYPSELDKLSLICATNEVDTIIKEYKSQFSRKSIIDPIDKDKLAEWKEILEILNRW